MTRVRLLWSFIHIDVFLVIESVRERQIVGYLIIGMGLSLRLVILANGCFSLTKFEILFRVIKLYHTLTLLLWLNRTSFHQLRVEHYLILMFVVDYLYRLGLGIFLIFIWGSFYMKLLVLDQFFDFFLVLFNDSVQLFSQIHNLFLTMINFI